MNHFLNFMMEYKYIFFMTLVSVGQAYINNFRFKHSNSFKGDVLPFRAEISGSYYLDLLGTPELSYIKDTNMEPIVTAERLKTNYTPVVCTGEMGKALASLNGEAHKNLAIKLNKLSNLVRDEDSIGITNLMSSWTTYIDISDPKYKCSVLELTLAPNITNGYLFKVVVEFNDYKPIFFTDALGVGMFTYLRSHNTKNMQHSSGNPIRFCGGTSYTGEMYTIEPRPKCPIATSEKSRHYGRAMVTVYKPNIVSVRRNITRCIQRLTHVHSYEDAFGKSRDSWRKTRNVRTTHSQCREWKDTLNACASFKVNSIREKDDYSYSRYDNEPNKCKFFPANSQNSAITEYETRPDLGYIWHYYHYASYDRDVRSGTLTNGFMEVSMPTTTMVTPWMNLPKEVKNKGYYEYNNVTMIWDPFQEDDLCLYVPRFRGEVSYIKYKHGDYNIPIDPASEEEEYTLFLIADQHGALFSTDSSQIIKDTSKLNCMPHKSDYRTTLYQSGGDQIIMVTVVDEGQKINIILVIFQKCLHT